MTPVENYGFLAWTLRERFDAIATLKSSPGDTFASAESAAFHGRKVVEGIAFCCLVAVQNGLSEVPRDAKGQWNAETILNRLKAKGISVLPSPSEIRNSTPQEQADTGAKATTIEGIPEKRLSHDELIAIYRRLHSWLHEVNPYVYQEQANFHATKSAELWSDLERLRQFVERHFISIRGKGFFCVLWDNQDQGTKVLPLEKPVA